MSQLVDNYLNTLDEMYYPKIDNRENVQEIFGFLFKILIRGDFIKEVKSHSKIDPQLTDHFRKLMAEIEPKRYKKKNWTIRLIDNENKDNVDVFTFGGDDIFISSKAKKILTEREIDAVLLHETGHILHLDTLVDDIADGALGTVGLAVLFFVLKKLINIIPVAELFGFICVFLTYLLTIEAPFSVRVAIFSKRAEYKADSVAIRHGYGNDLANALLKIEREMKAYAKKNNIEIREDVPCTTTMCRLIKKVKNIFSSHPETEDRIRKMKQPIKQKLRALQMKYAKV